MVSVSFMLMPILVNLYLTLAIKQRSSVHFNLPDIMRASSTIKGIKTGIGYPQQLFQAVST